MKNSLVIALAAFGLVTLAFPAGSFGAGAAAMSVTPSSGTYAVGGTFTVSIMLDSGGGIGVNAADGKLTFDPTVLAVQSISKGNSVFNLWVKDPSFSNTDGSVSFSGGSTEAYTGSAGDICDVTFKALKAGSTDLAFASADALAADGQGTNVLSGTTKGSFTVSGSAGAGSSSGSSKGSSGGSGGSSGGGGSSGAAAGSSGGDGSAGGAAPSGFTPSVTIASPTHPDPTKWYASANPNFTWQLTPDIAGVNAVLDTNPSTYPKRTSQGLISSKQYSNVAEGLSYFHVRFEDALGNWSDPVTMQVQIDVTPPQPFTVTAQPGAGISGRTVLLFNATDTVSGIDHYLVVFDGTASTTVALSDVKNGAYTAAPLLPGKHTVAVLAVDKAGNSTEADAEFDISGVSQPEITNFPAAVIEKSPIVLEGVADSGSNVTVDVNDGTGKVMSEGKMTADETGHWLYAVESGLSTGKYTLVVSMVTTQGAFASTTAKAFMDVIPAPFLDRFGWALIVLLVAVISGLVTFGFYKKKILDIQVALAKRENAEARVKTRVVFETLREEVDDQISHMEGGALQAQGEQRLEPERVLDTMRNALAISETTIQKEIDDVDKALASE
ncbi:MAG TPA: cohesin domain-containing protein [Candidatus Paceibacterota bacterium]|nr:cohesin domain-containing protein [Candidatus Paceibacterota bacterium]